VGIEPPGIHDLSDVLIAQRKRFPEVLQQQLEMLASGSRTLRRDRELTFSGAEDLPLSGFRRGQTQQQLMQAPSWL
jgi:hypothetical protein